LTIINVHSVIRLKFIIKFNSGKIMIFASNKPINVVHAVPGRITWRY
jgi:hypothetical protein